MTPPPTIRPATILRAYYAATTLFLLLDLWLDINIRLAFLDSRPGWRAAYY